MLLVVAVAAIAVVAVAGRPLLFASVDADVARAAGVPVRLLGFGFLLVLGLSVAETSQITGALLVFALLVTPAATAQQLTAPAAARPRALGRDRARRHVARARARLLLDLPRRLLRHLARLRAYVRRSRGRSSRTRRRATGRLMLAHEFMRNALLAGSFVGARVRARRLLRRAPRAGVRRRRAQPRRLHRRARRRRARHRRPRRASSLATILGGARHGLARRSRARRRRRDRHAVRLDRSASACSSSPSSRRASSAGNGTAGVRVLFGSIFGLSVTDAAIAAGVSLAAAPRSRSPSRAPSALRLARRRRRRRAGRARPPARVRLPRGARGSSPPQATQAVGALLLLGLLAAPAGAAHRLASTPVAGLALSTAFAVGSVWAGLALSYVFPTLPPSTMIISVATLVFVLAAGGGRIAAGRPRRAPRATPR